MEFFRDIFDNNKNAFANWIKEEPIVFSIISLFFAVYPFTILPLVQDYFYDIWYAQYVIPIFVFFIVILLYFHWKIFNYYLLDSEIDSTLLIEGNSKNFLIPLKNYIILTKEGKTFFNLNLIFSEGLEKELKKKGCYTLIFDKNHSLEIECKDKEYKSIDKGFKKDIYCALFNYTNVNEKSHLFLFDSEKEDKATLKIFFFVGDYSSNYKNKIKNKNPLKKIPINFDEIKFGSEDQLL